MIIDRIICPVCGGYIELDVMSDSGYCDTCSVHYIDGIIANEDNGDTE